MSKEFQIRDGNLIASFDLENEDGDIDFCKLLKVSHGVADEIGMFVDCVAINKIIKDQSKQIADLEAKLAESEKKVKHYHKLYNERDKQFQSVRQRYHLLNKLQSNYDKKDKLHLAYMQCKELVDENEKLKQQLHELPKKIEEEIKIQMGSISRILNKGDK